MTASLCDHIRCSMGNYYYSECNLGDGIGARWVTRSEFIATSAASILLLIFEIADPIFCGCLLDDNRTWSRKLHDMAIEIIAMPLGVVGMCFPQTVNTHVLGLDLRSTG